MNTYRRKHTPYTYLIGWSWLDIWYYGRRTKRGCHPDEFWVKYWTSSKEVERYRKLHGEPDIIIIKKIFGTSETDKCALWEHKVLRRLDSKNHPKMLNKHNGGKGYDNTGMKAAILVSTGEKLGNISVLDPRWKTGEIIAVCGAKKGQYKGMFAAILVSTGEKLGYVRTDDPRRKTGEIISAVTGSKGQYKGMKAAILLSTGENLGLVSLLDPRWETGEIIPANKKTNKGMQPAILVTTGERLGMVSLLDPRWKTGEIIAANSGAYGPQKNPSGPRGQLSEEHKAKLRGPRGKRKKKVIT